MSEDMHSMLGRYFSGQATEEEVNTVKKWIHANKENEAEFRELEKMWNKSEEYEPIAFDTERAWQKINTAIKAPAKRARIVKFNWKAAVAVAASLVLVVAAVWWMMGDNTDRQTIVAETDIKEVQLPDGSKVYLRKGAKLEYPETFAVNSRDVSLTGEAFFEVTPNPAQPFGITAADAYVKVIGTSFSVNTANNQVQLVVKTGKVNFGPAADTSRKVLVTAGEKARFAGNEIMKEQDVDVNSIAWVSKRLVFKDAPLEQIATTLSNYYGIKITLKKEDAAQIATNRITIEFNNQPLSAVLDELSLTTSYEIKPTSKDNYEISIK